MKVQQFLIPIFLLLFSQSVFSQLTSPRESTHQKIEQTIGLTTIAVDYHRPSKKNRDIFGGLVPYNKVWRTGANENTTVSFDNDVTINGKPLEKGIYALYTKPSKNTWTIYFYTDSTNWGTPRMWEEDKIALETTVPTIELPKSVENFTISFSNISDTAGSLDLIWDKVAVSIPMNVELNSVLQNNAELKLESNINDYSTAAKNYLSRKIHLNKAQKYIENAIYLREKPSYSDYRTYAQILAANKQYAKAIEAAQKSTKLAKLEGENYYTTSTINANEKDLEQWKKMK